MTLDADPTSATFNCYSTLAEANTYHSARLHNSAWTGADVATKEASLLWATRNFEILQWKGWQTDPAQPLHWPRTGVFKDGDEVADRLSFPMLYTQYMFGGATIPQFLKDATAELAFWLIQSDVTAPVGTEGFKRVKVDSIELEVDKQDRLKWMNDSVRNIVWRYLKNSNKYLAPVQRV